MEEAHRSPPQRQSPAEPRSKTTATHREKNSPARAQKSRSPTGTQASSRKPTPTRAPTAGPTNRSCTSEASEASPPHRDRLKKPSASARNPKSASNNDPSPKATPPVLPPSPARQHKPRSLLLS